MIAATTATHADTLVTFTVDMNVEATAIAGGSTLYVRGSFNNQGYGLNALNILTNNGSGTFSGTVNMTNAPGTFSRTP